MVIYRNCTGTAQRLTVLLFSIAVQQSTIMYSTINFHGTLLHSHGCFLAVTVCLLLAVTSLHEARNTVNACSAGRPTKSSSTRSSSSLTPQDFQSIRRVAPSSSAHFRRPEGKNAASRALQPEADFVPQSQEASTMYRAGSEMDDTAHSSATSVSDDALQYPSEVVTVWDQPPGRRRSAVSVLRTLPLESESNIRRRRRERRQSSVKMPDMLIFTLGLAALLSLIVSLSNILSTQPFRPLPLLVFAAAGTYCLVLIRRRQTLIAAEEERVAEYSQNMAAIRSSRRRRKTVRRSPLDYFIFRPPTGGEEHTRPTTPKSAVLDARTSVATSVAGEDRGSEEVIPGEFHPSRRESIASTSPAEEGAERSDVDVEAGLAAALDGGAGQSGRHSAEPSAELSVELSVEPSAEPPEDSARAPPEATKGPPSPEGSGRTEEAASSRSAAVPEEAEGRGGEEGSAEAESEAGMRGCGDPTSGKRAGSDESPKQDVRRSSSWQWSTAGSCIICFGEYQYGDRLCRLPCRHIYHASCIDEWLNGENHAWCPLCKRSLVAGRGRSRASSTRRPLETA